MVTDEELMELVKDGAPPAEDAENPVDGPCEICTADDRRAARYRCVRCDKTACPGHYWVMLGLCHACASETDVDALRREQLTHPRDYLHIKWVQD